MAVRERRCGVTKGTISVADAKVIARRAAALMGAPGDGTSILERVAADLLPGEQVNWSWPSSKAPNGDPVLTTISVTVTP